MADLADSQLKILSHWFAIFGYLLRIVVFGPTKLLHGLKRRVKLYDLFQLLHLGYSVTCHGGVMCGKRRPWLTRTMTSERPFITMMKKECQRRTKMATTSQDWVNLSMMAYKQSTINLWVRRHHVSTTLVLSAATLVSIILLNLSTGKPLVFLWKTEFCGMFYTDIGYVH